MPISDNARSAEAIRRKLRTLAAVFSGHVLLATRRGPVAVIPSLKLFG